MKPLSDCLGHLEKGLSGEEKISVIVKGGATGGVYSQSVQSFTKPLHYRQLHSLYEKFKVYHHSVFGVDAVKSVSVTEGDSVTLNSDDTEIQRDDLIMWTFGLVLIAKIKGKNNKREFYDERFRDRLQLDQTGSLSITNTRTTDSGLYKVTSSRRESPLNTFNLTVYVSSCVFLCSVVNVSHVTLSWYKGNSLSSSISVSDLSRSLSLSLECLDDSYSCVLNNPISNQTRHLNNTEICQPCSDSVSLIVLISAAAADAGSLLIVAAVGIFCIGRKHRKTDQEVQTRERDHLH
ncbi:uncharacterized protein LOC131530980 [Onychostoma macrolepis]|uniref:uncharacterized protein LOC131530980 n=1 Tax=Onychostoma macrolepis TaxID=369639 RepID=UPI00272AD110|nr:uncharacterized protein LOC131530980 [Onychostoma macrolepis]